MIAKNPNNFAKTNLMRKVNDLLLMGKTTQVKRLSLKLITFQSLCVLNTQRLGGLLMDYRVLYTFLPKIHVLKRIQHL
jgi:hypothetical protein